MFLQESKYFALHSYHALKNKSDDFLLEIYGMSDH